MNYTVSIWKSAYSTSPEIWIALEEKSPIAATLAVMRAFGLHSAIEVFVYEASGALVGQFYDIDLSTLSAPVASGLVVSYDYTL